MIINFVGNFQNGAVGEIADEVHLARELEALGHTVQRVPRDIWKAWHDGNWEPDWVDKLPIKADINLIGKWHHFNDGDYIKRLKDISEAPVLYWVWDWMNEFNPDNWHFKMAKEADLYLTGEGGLIGKYRQVGINAYYFQMDVCDGDLMTQFDLPNADRKKIYDVIFTGSMIQKGNRREWLQIINKKVPIKIWSWNYEEWVKLGFEAYPAVYGEEYNRLIAQSRIILGFSVEPHCFGYWSNRIGKVLIAGGKLLQEYAPGMEQFLPESVDYFSSPEEAVQKIQDYLKSTDAGDPKYKFTTAKFSSKDKIKQLSILMERFLKENNGEKWII